MDPDDEIASREFVAARWHPLARTAYLLTGDVHEAEDLVQTTMVRMHRHWTRIERRDAPQAYARTVLVHLATSSWRRRRRMLPTEVLPERTAVDEVARSDERDALLAACRTLPPRMRAVLVLRCFEDLTEAQTAQALGVSTGTVKSQTSKALARLRAVLGPDAADADVSTTEESLR